MNNQLLKQPVTTCDYTAVMMLVMTMMLGARNCDDTCDDRDEVVDGDDGGHGHMDINSDIAS